MAGAAPIRACEVELPIRVNAYDVDFQGIVNNIVYVRWFEDLRFRLLDEYLPLQQQMAAGYGPILMSTQIDYKRPVRLFDEPVGKIWLIEASKVRWTVGIEVTVGNAVAATGVQTGAFVDLKTLRPVRMPAVVTAALDRARAERQA